MAGFPIEVLPNQCSICSKNVDDDISLTRCYDCDLNYCSSCDAIRQMNLKELLLSEEAMQKHGMHSHYRSFVLSFMSRRR